AGLVFPPFWSPDGNAIAYALPVKGVQQVFTKDLQSLASTQLTNSKEDCIKPTWSVDGSRIYYVMNGDLWAVSAAGGPSEMILKNVEWPAVSTKNILVFRRTEEGADSIWFSDPVGAVPKKFTSIPVGTKRILDASINISHDGSMISAWFNTEEGPHYWICPYPSGKPRKIALPKFLQGSFSSWMPDNMHIV